MAEMLLRHALPAGSPWEVRSAGTGVSDGLPPSRDVIELLAEAGVPFDLGKKTNTLTAALIGGAALILPLERHHAQTVLARDPAARPRVRLLSSFAPRPRPPDIEDPFGSDPAVYRACLAEIRECIPGVVEWLKANG